MFGECCVVVVVVWLFDDLAIQVGEKIGAGKKMSQKRREREERRQKQFGRMRKTISSNKGKRGIGTELNLN